MSNSLRPHGRNLPDSFAITWIEPTKLLCPRDFPGKSTGVGCHFLLQGIFPTQGSNPGLPHCRYSIYFPAGSDSKESVYNAGDLGSISGLGRFPAEGNGNPCQYSCLENPMDGGAWCRLRKESDMTERLHFLSLYRYSRIPWWLRQ